MKSAFIGDTASIRELRRQALRFADAPFPILLQGETGTGKYELALLLHERSARTGEPFVDIHCANLSDTLFESTVFGHERGAFTDARERRAGKIERARDGTILFDDIDCLTPQQQAKLLRLLDRRQYERVGGVETLTTPAAFLFASNRDIRALASAGEFRPDLFARIACLVLRIPPLRERPDDIALLATVFLGNTSASRMQGSLRWSADALDLLCGYPWPGNVRELRNVVTVCAYAHNEERPIAASEVRPLLEFPAAPPASREDGLAAMRAANERSAIEDALRATRGNRVEAAKLLKIGRRTLHEKIARYGL